MDIEESVALTHECVEAAKTAVAAVFKDSTQEQLANLIELHEVGRDTSSFSDLVMEEAQKALQERTTKWSVSNLWGNKK